MFLALPLMPMTPGPKLDARVPAAQELLVLLAAVLLMPKAPEPIRAAQEPTELQPHRHAPELAELPSALQFSYPRLGRAVQAPSPHPPS